MTRPARILTLVLAVVVLAVSCTADAPPEQAAPGTTEAPAVTDTTQPQGGAVGPAPGEQWGATPPETVPVSIPPAQAEPSGFDDVSRASADALRACVGEGSCEGVEAPLVQWPGADLAGIDLSFATITGASFQGVQAGGADFAVANLSGADLTGANFAGANLSGADLTGATLLNTVFAGADLTGADLFDALAAGADFQAARFCDTRMPDGSIRDDHC